MCHSLWTSNSQLIILLFTQIISTLKGLIDEISCTIKHILLVNENVI